MTRVASDVAQHAIERYHALLQEAGWKTAEFDAFIEKMRQERIMYGDRVSVEYLRPQFLSVDQMALVKNAVETIWGALDRLSERFFTVPRLIDDLGLTPRERELVAVDPGYPGHSTMARFDSFLVGDHLQFVELNGESPAGPAYTEVMSEVFRASAPMVAFEREFEVKGFKTRDRLVEIMLSTYKAWGGQGTPTIAIVDWDNLSTRHEFELCKEYFTAHGIPTLVEDPRRLQFTDGRLRSADGTAIDLVYRRVLSSEFIGRWDEVQPMFEAYKAHAVCIVNNFRSKLLHKKMIFGLLTDGLNQDWFTPEQRATIARHIPWTRRVRAGTTDYAGAPIDLVSFIRAERHRMVLKPNDEYGGRGIYIGWTLSEAEWEEAIAKALSDDYVVQEKVKVASAEFPTIRDGELVYDMLNVDCDPFIWNGQVEGFLTRLSGTALCNVTSGGGIVPTFVVEPRAH